jgi:hypothetical protein
VHVPTSLHNTNFHTIQSQLNDQLITRRRRYHRRYYRRYRRHITIAIAINCEAIPN